MTLSHFLSRIPHTSFCHFLGWIRRLRCNVLLWFLHGFASLFFPEALRLRSLPIHRISIPLLQMFAALP